MENDKNVANCIGKKFELSLHFELTVFDLSVTNLYPFRFK